ncbi:MAG: hypothetical protein R2838_05305 [Caldilineaceae bacterium]
MSDPLEVQIAAEKINKYATSESGDTVEVVERPRRREHRRGRRAAQRAQRQSHQQHRRAQGHCAAGRRRARRCRGPGDP